MFTTSSSEASACMSASCLSATQHECVCPSRSCWPAPQSAGRNNNQLCLYAAHKSANCTLVTMSSNQWLLTMHTQLKRMCRKPSRLRKEPHPRGYNTLCSNMPCCPRCRANLAVWALMPTEGATARGVNCAIVMPQLADCMSM